MSDVWNKMIGELNNLGDTIAEKSEEYFKIAVEKGEVLSKKGKIQFEIESTKRELKKEKTALGDFVASKFHNEDVTDFTLNDQFQIYTDKILNLQNVITSLEKDKQNLNIKTETTPDDNNINPDDNNSENIF